MTVVTYLAPTGVGSFVKPQSVMYYILQTLLLPN